jgi:hypothetical protein
MVKRKERNLIEDIIWPAHESKRCEARAKSTGEPCRRWAAIGHHRCKFHGGAKGSGRPAVHGRRSVESGRNRAALRIARYLLRAFHGKPEE